MNPEVTAVVIVEREGAPEPFEWSTTGSGSEVRQRARAALEGILAYDSALGFFAAPVVSARIVLRDEGNPDDVDVPVLRAFADGTAEGPWA